jgi:hypothetical protein
MFKLTKLITFQPDVSEADRKKALATLAHAGSGDARIKRAMLQPTIEGVFHGGDYIWHLQFDHEEDYRAATRARHWRENVVRFLESDQIAHVDSAAYVGGASAVPEPDLRNGVYRTLFVTMIPGTPVEQIKKFEREMCEMPRLRIPRCSALDACMGTGFLQ